MKNALRLSILMLVLGGSFSQLPRIVDGGGTPCPQGTTCP